jgi:carbamate kinase
VAPVYSLGTPPHPPPPPPPTPAWLRSLAFPGGSMGPKVEAVCRFVEQTGKRAAIGQLEALPELVAGTAGTQIQT